MPTPIRRSRSWATPGRLRRLRVRPGLVSIRRRTKAGLEKAMAEGRKLGAPRRLSGEQEVGVIGMVGSGAPLGPSAYRLRQSGAP